MLTWILTRLAWENQIEINRFKFLTKQKLNENLSQWNLLVGIYWFWGYKTFPRFVVVYSVGFLNWNCFYGGSKWVTKKIEPLLRIDLEMCTFVRQHVYMNLYELKSF